MSFKLEFVENLINDTNDHIKNLVDWATNGCDTSDEADVSENLLDLDVVLLNYEILVTQYYALFSTLNGTM